MALSSVFTSRYGVFNRSPHVQQAPYSIQNTRETAAALHGLALPRAQKYLEDVLAHKDAIPFRRFTGKIGRHAQGKLHKAVQA